MQLRRFLVAVATVWGCAAWGADPYASGVPGSDPNDMVEVPGVVVSDGIPTRIRQIHSKWNVDNLFQYFFEQFKKNRLYVAPESQQPHTPRGYVLTGLDTDALIAYTVILQPLPDGSTTVILGSALPSSKDRLTTTSDTAPLFPGAAKVLRTTSEGNTVITYEAPAKPDTVASFYGQELARAGYSATRDPGTYQGNGREVLLYLKPASVSDRTLVSVTVRERPQEKQDTPNKK